MKLTFEQEKHVDDARRKVRKSRSGTQGDEAQLNYKGHWYWFRMNNKSWELVEAYTWTKKDLQHVNLT